MDKKKIKRIIAREGLAVVIFLFISYLGEYYTVYRPYVERPNFLLSTLWHFLGIYALYLLVRFIFWALRTLREK